MDTPILIIYTLHSVYIVSHPTVHRSGHPNRAIWLAVFHLHVFQRVYAQYRFVIKMESRKSKTIDGKYTLSKFSVSIN